MGPVISTRSDATSLGYMKVGVWGGGKATWHRLLCSAAAWPAKGRAGKRGRGGARAAPISWVLPPRAQAWVEGAAQSGAPVFADVRDVARAHVLAAENPSASGRYIVANSHSTPPSHISAWLQVCVWRGLGRGRGGGSPAVYLLAIVGLPSERCTAV
jgi:hypothetical protein